MMKYITDWYLWYFVLLAIFAFIYVQQKNRYMETVGGITLKNEDNYRSSFLFSFIVFLPIIIIASTRWELIGDTWAYIQAYKSLPSSVPEYLSKVNWSGVDPGFYLFSTVIKSLFGDDYRIWLSIIAIIQGVCLAITYRRYSNDIVTCAFLFFASADYLSWMMNGMRQFLVVSLLFAFFPLLQKRKFILYLFIVLVLSTVHRSCLIVIPLYLCSLGKPFNKRTLFFLTGCFVAMVFAAQFLNVLDDSLQGTVYSKTVSQFDDDGTNLLRVLVYAVPSILAIIYRKNFNDDTPEIIRISVNMSLICTGIYFISMVTSGIYIGRVPIYFSLFNYILLPWEINHFFVGQTKRLIRIIMILAYFVFYYFSMVGIS